MSEPHGTPATKNSLFFTTIAVAATAGTLLSLNGYIRREKVRRGYPSWVECQCDYKTQTVIFQVWYSRHEQRGETIVSHEWGSYLVNPPLWLRQFLHNSSQVIAILNPWRHYVERTVLNPQEAQQFASILRGNTARQEETTETEEQERDHVSWRREVLHFPRYLFDVFMRRIYPVHIARERIAQAKPLQALWDPHINRPTTTEGSLLETPLGTRIDYIGWSPSQISYCTARLHPAT